MGQLLRHSLDSFWVISGSFSFQNYVHLFNQRILKWLLFLVSITSNSKREIFKGCHCQTQRHFPKRTWCKFWFLSSLTNPREHRLKEGFVTPAVKHHSVSVSWHLETSLRTINQKNLLNIASSNGEGVFSWLGLQFQERWGVCMCTWFWKIPWAGCFIMSIHHFQQELEETDDLATFWKQLLRCGPPN